jgi:hypothetical protein
MYYIIFLVLNLEFFLSEFLAILCFKFKLHVSKKIILHTRKFIFIVVWKCKEYIHGNIMNIFIYYSYFGKFIRIRYGVYKTIDFKIHSKKSKQKNALFGSIAWPRLPY